MKNGIKTTEFWLALIATIITFLNEQLGFNLPKEAILTIAGIIISYILSRTVVKVNATKKNL